MRHLGDITKIHGGEIETVDVIIGGSPCQDLSVAGKRAGLAGARSGLYMDQIRIVKEMREHDRNNGRAGFLVRPRYMLWENVPGAFSSNKGEDFAAVLEEAIRIAEPEAPTLSVPPKGWPTSGCLYSDVGAWSLAWRVLDAQFWGVPQRRRRIALVADFGGMSAPEILFERESMRGHSAQSGTPWQGSASNAQDCVGADDREGESADGAGRGLDAVAYSFDSLASNSMKSKNPHSGCRQVEVAKTLDTTDPNPSKNQGGIAIVELVPYTLKVRSGCEGGGKGALIQTDKSDQYLFQPVSIENHPADSRVDIDESGKVQTLTSRMGTGGGNVPMVMEPVIFDGANVTSPVNASNPVAGDPCHTLSTDSRNILVKTVYCLQGNCIDRSDTASCNGKGWKEDVGYTPNTVDRPAVAYTMQGFGDYKDCGVASGLKARDYKDATDLVCGVDCRNMTEYPELYPTLQAKPNGGQSLNFSGACRVRYIVRRLTPTECERLQGFPDGWTDIGEWTDTKGKVHKESSDSARYKALGNSIALPPWKYVLKRISAQYERDATLGSLFDGIGGFPLIWEQVNGKGSARWASEIEEFPIAVTKKWFGEEANE